MHFFKTAAVLIVSVICSSLVACPGANILHPKLNGASSWSEYEKSVTSSISNDQEQSFRNSVRQDISLSKRGKDLNLNCILFEPGALLLPIQVAAEILEEFYTHIAIKSHGEWAKNAPRIWIRITFGTIRLLMTATEGTTIPWDFVTGFAMDMLRLAKLGYTGMYTANFVNPTVGNAIWISLYQCTIGPFTDPAAIGVPAKVASCLNPTAQSWFPPTIIPTR